MELSADHWKAALQNVSAARGQLATLHSEVGLEIGSPASIFKGLLSESLINAGVTDRPTILVEENRQSALGLAINWGIRFLIAYAAELTARGRKRKHPAHDIWWLRSLL